jgi:hypothetical protein
MTDGHGSLLAVSAQIQAVGVSVLQNVANALNDRGVRTARGGAWHNSTVRNLLARGRKRGGSTTVIQIH